MPDVLEAMTYEWPDRSRFHFPILIFSARRAAPSRREADTPVYSFRSILLPEWPNPGRPLTLYAREWLGGGYSGKPSDLACLSLEWLRIVLR